MRSGSSGSCSSPTTSATRSAARSSPARSRTRSTSTSRNRIITNGSIYMDLVQLTAGQEMLLARRRRAVRPRRARDRPGRRVQGRGRRDVRAFRRRDDELTAQWELASYQDGHQLLARTIRYVEDRRVEERRFTGAIEEHPSPLHIIWGKLDPVAAYPMAERLHGLRPEAPLVTLEDIGHYPMVEAPDAFSAAMLAALDELAPSGSAPEQERGVVVEEARRLLGARWRTGRARRSRRAGSRCLRSAGSRCTP